jgi:hypothetical protein
MNLVVGAHRGRQYWQGLSWFSLFARWYYHIFLLQLPLCPRSALHLIASPLDKVKQCLSDTTIHSNIYVFFAHHLPHAPELLCKRAQLELIFLHGDQETYGDKLNGRDTPAGL